MRKNVNPKSLKGRDQLDRVRELMGKMQPLNENTSLSELELIKKGPNNVIYGIVRENHKYFIKTTNKTYGKIVAEDFNYIGGLQNKFSEAYNSYAAATKQLNLKFDMLNESLGINTHTNILESDGVRAGFGFVVEEAEIAEEDKPDFLDLDKDGDKEESMKKAAKDAKNESDEEKEIEEQKKVLKVDAPAPAEPAMEEPVEDEVDDFGGEELDMEEPSMDDEGDDEEDSTKKIQKLTGKIGQAIRELDEPDAELEKYVINSIISALHLDQFSDEDIEDIIAKLEGEEEEDDAEAAEAGEMDMEEPAMEEEPAEEEVEMEVTEESVVYKKSQLVESLTKKILKESIEEHHMGQRATYTDYPKYDVDAYKIMDEDFDMEMSSMYVDCPECMGSGCNHCDELGYHLANEFDGGDVSDDFMMLNADGEYGPFDRDGDDIPSDIDMDDDGDGVLELGMNEVDMMEDDGYGIDVLDSVSADFDIDGDGISSKIDNVYGDGEGLDDLDLDIDFFSEPGIAPSKPGTKDPIIKPKTPPKRGPWTKPKTRPNPKAVREGDNMSKPKRSFRRKGFYK